jgi:hypothetical protein
MSFNVSYALENAIAGTLGMIPEVGSVLSALVYILWPPSQEDIWSEIKDQVEALVDQQISAEVYQQVQQDLQGLQAVIGRFQQAVAAGDNADTMTQWDIVDDAFVQALPHFQAQGYQLSLAPLFAQFVNLHLAVMRDGVLFGAQWGWPAATLQDHSQNLTTTLSQYLKYANQIYEEGFATWTGKAAGDLQGLEHKIEPFKGVNAYTRGMTLTLLDFTNLWKYFDPSVYPNPVSVYLDREIYSDPCGTADDSGPIKLPTPPTQPISQITVWGADRVESVQLTYPAGGGPGGVTTTARQGFSGSGSPAPPRGGSFNVSANPVTSVTCAFGSIVNSITFTFADGTTSNMLGGGYPGGTPTTFSYPGEILSSIHISGNSVFYDCADCAVFGFKFTSDQKPDTTTLRNLYISAPKPSTLADLASWSVTKPVAESDLATLASAEGWDDQRQAYQKFVASTATR